MKTKQDLKMLIISWILFGVLMIGAITCLVLAITM